MKKPSLHFRLTIGTKLIGLIAILLISSIATIVFLSTKMYVGNDKENIRVSNVETTGSLAFQMREIFGDLAEKMRYLGTVLVEDASTGAAPKNELTNPVVRGFFDKDPDFLGIAVLKSDGKGAIASFNTVFSPAMAQVGDADGSKAVATLTSDHAFSANQLFKGETEIIAIKLADGSSAIAISVPLVQSDTNPGVFTHAAAAFIRPTTFSAPFAENSRGSSYLVDRRGIVLAHTDATHVGEDFSSVPVVKEFLTGSSSQNMVPYIDSATHEARLASYRAVGFAGLGVVSELPQALAYQAANTMAHRSALVGLIILFLAFWAGYMYAGTITRPIQKLVAAAQRIASGDFKINLKARGKDEVAHLSRAFNEMAKGLEERDRVKETFNKFHNKEIAEKLLSGEVKLGGERREATIFFSDVRGFTAMSETMQPEQVVEMLNEYMTRMVAIIRAHHGIVDKYVGDAIMALWGVPIGSPDDTCNAVRACLAMREDLAKLNELRISRGQVPLKIGMGLNIGPVIAGNIGSTEKMEYTVIGDTVNLASRMESMTKEYGTDFLVPEAIRERVKDRFVFEKCKTAKVKGKSQAIEIYKIRGFIDESGREVVIDTPFSSYASEKSDKVVHEEHNEPAPRDEIEMPTSSFSLFDRTGFIEKNPKPVEPAPETEPALFASRDPEPTPPPFEAPPSTPTSGAELEKYYVKMFGEAMGPFTEAEIRQGLAAGEFPQDATVSQSESGEWTSIAGFTARSDATPPPPSPPPFKKAIVPPPFRGKISKTA